MSPKAETDTIEEVRLLIADPEICADIAEIFAAEGIAAYGEYRDEPEEVLIRDAYEDRVDYIVYMDAGDLFRGISLRKKDLRDLLARVYLRREGVAKTMSIGATVKMVQQRRFMPPR